VIVGSLGGKNKPKRFPHAATCIPTVLVGHFDLGKSRTVLLRRNSQAVLVLKVILRTLFSSSSSANNSQRFRRMKLVSNILVFIGNMGRPSHRAGRSLHPRRRQRIHTNRCKKTCSTSRIGVVSTSTPLVDVDSMTVIDASVCCKFLYQAL
jgi:hypothetical protein